MRIDTFGTAARVAVSSVVVALGACTAPMVPAHSVDASIAPVRTAASVSQAVTDHVLVISIDGLRPDAIDQFRATTLQRLMREGSYTLNAKTIMPSRTLPSHTSMLTGLEPHEHGITWNSDETDTHGVVAVPTIFAKARERGLSTAAFFSKSKFHHLEVPRTLNHSEAPDGSATWDASRTVANVNRYLRSEKPNLLFVHLAEPDYAGHRFGWMSWFYGRAVRKADGAVAELLKAADAAFGKGQYAVILTADHGGHGWSHGSSDPRDVTIPWIAWGEGVRAGARVPDGVRTMDTAATALWLLGLPSLGVGHPVQTAFRPAAIPATGRSIGPPAGTTSR